ncbi:MAG TPA: cytochrome c [Xanthomonadaceae bacterium]|nr:cytochrome c [Xanthomonadaceae bacterium]
MKTTWTGPAIAVALLLAFPMCASAAGDIEAGKHKSQVCQACHGPTGTGTGDPQYPIIAGQHADYLVHSLEQYRSGERVNPIMAGFTATLSEQDMEDLAAFYAAQESPLTDISHLK